MVTPAYSVSGQDITNFNMRIFAATWPDFKALVSSKSLNMQYVQENGKYKVFAQEGAIVYRYDIQVESPANADQADFEANYQSGANQGMQAMP